MKKILRPIVLCAMMFGVQNAHSLKFDEIHCIFDPGYDVSLYGIEKLVHPFDGCKYSKVAASVRTYMQQSDNARKIYWHTPSMVTQEDLLLCHTQRYLDSLNSSATVARIAEVFPLKYVPNYFLRKKILKPMLLATGGTILGAQLALEHGCAINLSGGYHHAKSDNGEGFCVYADIPIAIKKLWQTNPQLRVMIIDLDAHRGNGVESILKNDTRVHILDMYNNDAYPRDTDRSTQYIKTNVPIAGWYKIKDAQYLDKLTAALEHAFTLMSHPDLIIYNAGTDIFEKDLLGGMGVTKQGIITRDVMVFGQAKERNIPILMVLSGGYTPESARIISDSIEYLKSEILLTERTQ